MASVYYLFDDAVHTEEDIVLKYADQEQASKKTYFAAVKIQKSYRGYATRKIVKKWHAAATMIQKMVRGWLVRYQLPDIMHEYYDQYCYDRYSGNATKIQSLWKGYTQRKIICIKDHIKERERITAENENIQATLRERAEEQQEALDPSVMRKVIEVLFERHHFLRTHQKEGIFSKRDSRELSELEKILRSMKWKDYMDTLRKYYYTYNKQDVNQYIFDDKKLRKMEDLYRNRDKSRNVWVEDTEDPRLKEKPFNTKIDRKPYERWLATTGKFSLPITEIVRTEDKSKNICDKDFDLHVLKKFAKEADVPAYYINFWYEQCKIHNISE